jgi:nucleotide-binding universal stress UspA family protein
MSQSGDDQPSTPPKSPTSAAPPPQIKGAMMSYAERRMSQQGIAGDVARRRTSSFGTYSRIVIMALDTSEFSKNAFDWYLANVWKLEDLIVLVHCPEVPKLPTFSFKSGIAPPVEEWKKILDDMNARTRKLEEDYESACTMKKLKFKVRGEAYKNIGEGICRIADDEGADLIVCGNQGTGSSKFKGSVCDFLTRNSQIPVVIVPTKK